jgi:hypothetical protein
MLAPLVLLLCLRCPLADLPVHCLRHQIVGQWELTLGPLSPSRSSCGHMIHDEVSAQPDPDRYFPPTPSTSSVLVDLSLPNIATVLGGGEGRWTMVYDEAIEIALGQGGEERYLAFSRFDLSPGGRNMSRCGETGVGWYSGPRGFGCWRGRRRGGPVLVDVDPVPLYTPPPAPRPIANHTLTAHLLNTFLSLGEVGWRARAYPDLLHGGRGWGEVNALLGVKRAHRPRAQGPRELRVVRSHLALPETFDWRKERPDILDRPMRQGEVQYDCKNLTVVLD